MSLNEPHETSNYPRYSIKAAMLTQLLGRVHDHKTSVAEAAVLIERETRSGCSDPAKPITESPRSQMSLNEPKTCEQCTHQRAFACHYNPPVMFNVLVPTPRIVGVQNPGPALTLKSGYPIVFQGNPETKEGKWAETCSHFSKRKDGNA